MDKCCKTIKNYRVMTETNATASTTTKPVPSKMVRLAINPTRVTRNNAK
jgi:hypothetical protein